jgi:hypothetical protein
MAKPPSNAAIIQRGLSSAKAGGEEEEKSTRMKRMEEDREDKIF